LKVPSLPFHSLISILSKFPADDDSRVFWSSTLRDLLYDITYAAVQILLLRNEENPSSDWATLIAQVVRSAMDCQAFTPEQMSRLSDILEAALPQSSSSRARSCATSSSSTSPQTATQEEFAGGYHGIFGQAPRTYGDLAEEFGVEPHLIEALAQRLSGLHMVGKTSDSL